jgi:hypothetical protein
MSNIPLQARKNLFLKEGSFLIRTTKFCPYSAGNQNWWFQVVNEHRESVASHSKMIPSQSSAEELLERSASFECDDIYPNERRKQHEQQQQEVELFLGPIKSQSLETTASSSTWTSSIERSIEATDSILGVPPSSSSCHSGTNGSNRGSGNRRRHSSVSFQETLYILEVENLVGKSKDVVPEDIWYTKEELREIRSRCKKQALETERTDGILERGLERMVPRRSPRHSMCCQNSKNIVFLEQANEILEHGFLCHTDQLADEYRRASEISKIQARSRGCKDAVHAWGHPRSKHKVVRSSSISRNSSGFK